MGTFQKDSDKTIKFHTQKKLTLSSWSSANVWHASSGFSSLSSGIKGHQMSLRLELSGVSSGLWMWTITSSLRNIDVKEKYHLLISILLGNTISVVHFK